MMINWTKLRDKYFNECTYRQFPIDKNSIKINMAPHDLFEWFKKEIESELNKTTCENGKIDKIYVVKKGTKEAKKLNKLFEK